MAPVVGLAPSTDKRDTLIATEKYYQGKWKAMHLFEVDAPSLEEIPFDSMSPDDIRMRYPKFYGTMAYPYLNGTMHAGHSFTASKIEFAIGFARMQGQRTLFPIGFHCTGMPIKACADKLAAEIELFGPQFERYCETHEEDPDTTLAVTETNTRVDLTRFVSQKSKATSKTVKLKYQFQIMLALGISRMDISKFADAAYWLEYFPPVVIQDLDDFGARIDWRRQFVTTEANPYYDAFVRWQMNRLREMNKILYGHRYTIYSPKDGQPCMDHDRTEGEGIIPAEYTAIKLELKVMSPRMTAWIEGKLEKDSNVFFIAATLRPETVYGQTCVFVGPNVEYGLYCIESNKYYVTTPQAAWNMAFQGHFFSSDALPREESELVPLCITFGCTFVGCVVNAPYSIHTGGVRVLPMSTLLPDKGTGVVISVPSDSPDDYITQLELSKRPHHYGIEKEWASQKAIPIIETASYGNMIAPFLIEKMKIASPRDATSLAEAKVVAYKEGHFRGKMLVGEFVGEPVIIAKDKVKARLVEESLAFPYAEPDGVVVSRSGDRCVVAYMGQWFLNYGSEDPEWQEQVVNYIADHLETYSPETKHNLLSTVKWLNRWACARSYGLGSKLPWDDSFVVESLSDSTIYHAYYTVAHLLHSDRFGTMPGHLGVRSEQMSDDVWDCIFGLGLPGEQVSQTSGIPLHHLQAMKREFEYWYPLDMSVTGKDLVPNHVAFFLYIHQAIFPRKHWPKAVRSNGHLLLNRKKMSKSTGNFLTLRDAVKRFGADATRIAMADAGDTAEDANFDEAVANSTILRLSGFRKWAEEVMNDQELRTGPASIWDLLFENELRCLVHSTETSYKATQFRTALRSGFYDFITARDFYREATKAADIGMHEGYVRTYLELQALLVAPIAPHWAEYLWLDVLHKKFSIQTAQWPQIDKSSIELSSILDYVRTTVSRINSMKTLQEKKKAKGKNMAFDPKRPKRITLILAEEYPRWQTDSKNAVRDAWNWEKKEFDELKLSVAMMKLEVPKQSRPFFQLLKKKVLAGEALEDVVRTSLPFDEASIARETSEVVRIMSGFDQIEVVGVSEWQVTHGWESAVFATAVPGLPGLFIEEL